MTIVRRVNIADPAISDNELCRREDVAEWLKIGVSTFDLWRHQRRTPKPCTPKGTRPRWRVGDVRAFYSRIQEPQRQA